mmetsp:Transcript_831/g.1621  ORF Transcript_831/g.1621 Transcript_831/m.1621 type:complete len:98 (-) Transcript_831:909-1202(-)
MDKQANILMEVIMKPRALRNQNGIIHNRNGTFQDWSQPEFSHQRSKQFNLLVQSRLTATSTSSASSLLHLLPSSFSPESNLRFLYHLEKFQSSAALL